MNYHVIILSIAFCLGLMLCNFASAHDCFKEPLEERYKLKTVSCKTCHPNNKDRSIHNKLGIIFENALKGKNLTKQFKDAEAADEKSGLKKDDENSAVFKVNKVLVAEFNKVIPEVEKSELTIADMIKFGLINGMRLNDEGKAAAEEALKAEAAKASQ